MKGDLQETFQKDGRTMTRALNPDRQYSKPNGGTLVLAGSSLMLVRNIDIHIYRRHCSMPMANTGRGFLDAKITSLIAMHDLRGTGPIRNSRAGSVYIVKPKMHGPRRSR